MQRWEFVEQLDLTISDATLDGTLNFDEAAADVAAGREGSRYPHIVLHHDLGVTWTSVHVVLRARRSWSARRSLRTAMASDTDHTTREIRGPRRRPESNSRRPGSPKRPMTMSGKVSSGASGSGHSAPTVLHPDVSIVIVTDQGAEVVETALQALLENTEPCYELILIDNGSTDRTPTLLQRVGNSTVVLNERNDGFGVANNAGADRARGRYLLFLNQDAFVHRGWLPPLLERIESDSAIGAVGPMLLNTDGTLQCAGARLFRTGDTRCYGEGEDPKRPEYGLARDVDYLAGACLLTRRSAFNDVGGFNPAYGLAYFEDADLCLSLATRGYRSVYEPRSRVTHVRGQPSDALLEVAARNQALFERRWREVLASRPLPPPDTSGSVDSLPVRAQVACGRSRVAPGSLSEPLDADRSSYPSPRPLSAPVRSRERASRRDIVSRGERVLRRMPTAGLDHGGPPSGIGEQSRHPVPRSCAEISRSTFTTASSGSSRAEPSAVTIAELPQRSNPRSSPDSRRSSALEAGLPGPPRAGFGTRRRRHAGDLDAVFDAKESPDLRQRRASASEAAAHDRQPGRWVGGGEAPKASTTFAVCLTSATTPRLTTSGALSSGSAREDGRVGKEELDRLDLSLVTGAASSRATWAA